MAYVLFSIGVVIGFLVLAEMVMTIAWGPLELVIPPKEGDGDVDEVSVMVVTPEMPRAYFPQVYQQQQPYLYDEFYTQQSIQQDDFSSPSPSYKSYEYDQYQQQPNQQRQQQQPNPPPYQLQQHQ
jgi:hypothetical protein